jgi:SM-20-related protein
MADPERALSAQELDALSREGWFHRDAVLGTAGGTAVRDLIEALAAAGGLRRAGIQRKSAVEFEPAIRGDAIAWIGPALPAALRPLHAWFLALRDALNRRAYLGLDGLEIQVARYPGDGACYRRHRDGRPAAPGEQPARRITAIYYANPGWRPEHGGQLRLHLAGGPVDLDPILDRAVVFLSEEVLHEVRPAFAPRRAVTAWFRARDALGR